MERGIRLGASGVSRRVTASSNSCVGDNLGLFGIYKCSLANGYGTGSKGDKSLESVFNSNLSLSLAFSPKILKEDPLDLGSKSLKSKSNDNSIKEISCSSSKLKSNVDESSNGNRHALSAFKPVSSNSYKNNNLYREFKAFRPQFRSDFHSHSLNTNIFPFLSSCTPVPLLPSLTKDPSPTIMSSTSNPEIADWQRLYRNSSLSTTINSKLIDTSKTSILNSIPSTSASDPCAEVETLVSNLGRGKGGHLCLYCGKVYSRKYGLKIHIRTHTGYKPLKCRICFRPFGDPSNLNKHVRLHAQGRISKDEILKDTCVQDSSVTVGTP
ncbi:PR domain zinc finger protein 13 [Armadillidium vulgare]|nr:PR domain zinc finger protein 13 [Armadillidium vulgare]